MQDDKTVIMPQGVLQKEFDSDRTVLLPVVGLRVSLVDVQAKATKEFFFAHGFTAGRSQNNDIVIQHGDISRHHLEVKQENGEWWVYDLNSANGVYIQDRLIEHKSKLNLPLSVSLGKSGIALNIQAVGQSAEIPQQAAKNISVPSSPIVVPDKSTHRDLSKEAIKARLLAKEEAEDSGDYTRMVRKLIHEDRTIRVKKYNKVIWILGILILLSVTLVAYQQIALSNARTLAIDMFYDIKTLEVSMSKSEVMIQQSAEILEQTLKAAVNQKLAIQERLKAEQEKIAAEKERVAQEKKKLKSMKAKYQQYVNEATFFRIRLPSDTSYEEELIAKVAREFGESELE